MKITFLVLLACGYELSECAVESDINLYFYSKTNPREGILTNISDPKDVAKTVFSAEKDTIICIHGWRDTANSTSCQNIKNTLLKKYDTNVFILDWDKIADHWFYPEVIFQIESLGKILATFMKNFVNTSGLNLDKTRILGHSTGAHIAGVTGNFLDGKLDHIIGLDPAGPLFIEEYTKNRLSTSSAKFVQAIHTCGDRQGYFKPIGHADYYPNGGKVQSVCDITDFTGKCSHLIVLDYYSESVITGKFKAKKCNNYNDYEQGKCDDGEVSLMGEYDIDKKASGTYFLETNKQPPYAKN